MKSMVESKLDPNHLYGDETPMLIAARLGHHDVIAVLVKHVDNIDELAAMITVRHSTMLLRAAATIS